MRHRIEHTNTAYQTLPGELEGADLGRRISELREGVDLLTERIDTLARLCAKPGLDERLVVVEGPFVGDAPAALETCRRWLERSRQALDSPAQSLAMAHIAAGGLASKG